MDNIPKKLKTLSRNILCWTTHLLMHEGNNSYLERRDTIDDYQKLQDKITDLYKNYKKNEAERLDKCKR